MAKTMEQKGGDTPQMKKKIAVKDIDSFIQGLKFGAVAVVFSKIDFNKLFEEVKKEK